MQAQLLTTRGASHTCTGHTACGGWLQGAGGAGGMETVLLGHLRSHPEVRSSVEQLGELFGLNFQRSLSFALATACLGGMHQARSRNRCVTLISNLHTISMRNASQGSSGDGVGGAGSCDVLGYLSLMLPVATAEVLSQERNHRRRDTSGNSSRLGGSVSSRLPVHHSLPRTSLASQVFHHHSRLLASRSPSRVVGGGANAGSGGGGVSDSDSDLVSTGGRRAEGGVSSHHPLPVGAAAVAKKTGLILKLARDRDRGALFHAFLVSFLGVVLEQVGNINAAISFALRLHVLPTLLLLLSPPFRHLARWCVPFP